MQRMLRFDALVAYIRSSSWWGNGAFTLDARLPSTASATEVADRYMADYHITHYKVLAVQEVQLDAGIGPNYTAVLIKSNIGEMVIFMQYHSNMSVDTITKTLKETTDKKTVTEVHKGGWWTMVIDVK